jgi:hypothetical protein
MNIKQSLLDFSICFVVTLVVTALVTLLWNLLFHNSAIIDWETAFRFAFVLGIVIPWAQKRNEKDGKVSK